MKRMLALVLAMTLLLTALPAIAEGTGIWEKREYVDEFNEPTDAWYVSLVWAVNSVGWQSIFSCFIMYPFVHRRKTKWIKNAIPDNVSHIGVGCFQDVRYYSIVITENSKLTEIPAHAFYGYYFDGGDIRDDRINIDATNITSIGD